MTKASLITRISDSFRHTLVQNALSLYGVQIAGYVLPLVTIPYLARVLGAAGWGLLAFTQAFGNYWTILGEYGFSLSATREVAFHRDNRDKLTEIVAGVLGAKIVLSGASIPFALLAQVLIPTFREHPALLWMGMFWAVTQGFSVMWLFQGFERMRLVAALDISTKVLSTAAIFIFVRRPDQGSRVLFIQGLGFLLSLAIGLALAYRTLPIRFPTRKSVHEALRMGWGMFLLRGSISLYTAGNAFILGLFVSPQIVGYYAGAEKISKAFLGLLNPLSQTLYPRLSHLIHRDRDRAARLARFGVVLMGGGGALLAALVFAAAPKLVQILLGPGFTEAISPLRILCLLLPIVGINFALGFQWMLPLGLEGKLNKITLMAGVINVALAAALAYVYRDLTMTWAVIFAELVVTFAIWGLLRSMLLSPLGNAIQSADAT
jgi:PST family polysaccharide transporter